MAEMCFGCGADNPQGLHIVYDYRPDGTVASSMSLGDQWSGEPGIVHGGIQATVLDEVMGRAVRRAIEADQRSSGPAVTATMSLRFRAPCPTDARFVAIGTVTSLDWPSVHVTGTLENPAGDVLTEATARWRVLGATAD